jgi:arginyl-tRNA synthetase
MRRTSSHLDFDLETAKKQTPENPVYYVQYAHARICSILKNSQVKINAKTLTPSLLKEKEEIALIKKILQLQDVLNICHKTLDPYALTVYLQEVAEAFHKFYDLHRVLGQEEALTHARLALIQAARVVLATGLELMGISRPESM